MRKVLWSGIILFLSASSQAQTTKSVTDVQQVWLGYFNQSRFTDKFGIWVDLHLRTQDDFTKDLLLVLTFSPTKARF